VTIAMRAPDATRGRIRGTACLLPTAIQTFVDNDSRV